MKRLTNIVNYLKYLPKTAVMALAVIGLVVAPVAINAGWGPNRPVKDYNNPQDRMGFDRVVFNSFINTPSYGDERAFFDGKDATNTGAGGFQTEMNVKDGQEIHLRIYVHNNANPERGTEAETTARDTNVRVMLPTGTDRALRSIGYISASNATPGTVTDTMDFVNESPFRLEYVAGSARAHSQAGAYQVSDSIVNGGAPIGFNGPNGNVPGCFDKDVVVTLRVKVKEADFKVSKQVRKEGTQDWKENVEVKTGDKVEYLIEVKNNSDAQLRNVVVGDKLPAHMTYVDGSTKLANDQFPDGTKVNDNITKGGIDIGHYSPGANAFIKFTAKVTDNAAELKCGKNVLRNKAVAQPEGEEGKEDTADVTVPKECQETPPETPEQPGLPTELPNTGPATAALGALGSGALGLGARNYLRSRKHLLDTLLSK